MHDYQNDIMHTRIMVGTVVQSSEDDDKPGPGHMIYDMKLLIL